MTPARCPVCDDIISIGVSVKLNQAIICPTCLASLQVVAMSPLELELPERHANLRTINQRRTGSKKNHKDFTRRSTEKPFSEFGEPDYEDELDDYTLERILRHKPEKGRLHKGE